MRKIKIYIINCILVLLIFFFNLILCFNFVFGENLFVGLVIKIVYLKVYYFVVKLLLIYYIKDM